ncbi:MAG: S9 family peptidase [Candidatus Marinimicrobia bacterium]|nr:S9 family peptidase [Candidatus Neomarinimicrobiota bacterium]
MKFYLIIFSIIFMACMKTNKYPNPKRDNKFDNYHGIEVHDPYRWMENLNDPKLKNWIETENELTKSVLDTIPEKEFFKDSIEELQNYEKKGMPYIRGDKEFYFKNNGTQNQYVLYVKEGGVERILIDPNKNSKDGTISIGFISLNGDGSLMAYGQSNAGSDWTDIYVMDVVTGEIHNEILKWVKFSGIDWSPQNDGFYYSRYPKPEKGKEFENQNNNQKLYFHKLNTTQDKDKLIYEDTENPEYSPYTIITNDHKYLILGKWHGTSKNNTVYYRELNSNKRFIPLIDEWIANMNFVGNDGDIFYFKTDYNAPKNRLIAMDIKNPKPQNWVDIIPEKKDVLTNVRLVYNQFIVEYRKDVSERIEIYSIDGQYTRSIGLPGKGSINGVRARYKDRNIFYTFSSYLYPSVIFKYDLETYQQTLWFEPKINFSAEDFTVEQVFYPSKDGTKIPMYLVYAKNIIKNSSNPTLLYGYGGFQISIMPSFSIATIAWIKAGGIYAVANLRGGSEYGEEWHTAGMLHNKQNVFDDFISAGEFLIEQNYTQAKHLSISGRSNGGLLTAASVLQRPDLFGAVESSVAVADMLRYHKFTIGWAWLGEYGNPDKKEDFEVLYKYSPIHNVKSNVDYPPIIITTGDYDDRVVPSHSFKMAATFQHEYKGNNPIIIRIDTDSGHGSGKPISKWINEKADVFGFLLHHTK